MSPIILLILIFCLAKSDEYERQYQILWTSVEDRTGLEAIRSLHQQLDDDNDGTIEPSETGDFIKADLQVCTYALSILIFTVTLKLLIGCMLLSSITPLNWFSLVWTCKICNRNSLHINIIDG